MIHAERVISSGSKLPPLVETALDALPDNTLLLDIGAGSGRLSQALANRPGIQPQPA